VAVWSNPTVPDRTRALLGIGPTPVPAMVDGVNRLLAVGADIIAIPCNTAHAYLDQLAEQTGARFLNMVQPTVDAIINTSPAATRIGLLATAGTTLAPVRCSTPRGATPRRCLDSSGAGALDRHSV
jgi:aspartate racemase